MSGNTQTHNEQRNELVNALKSSDIDNIYFNEFALGVSKNDLFILVRCNGKEEAILNLSHITAKSLALSLTEAISRFEEKTNQKIMISDEVEKMLDNNNG